MSIWSRLNPFRGVKSSTLTGEEAWRRIWGSPQAKSGVQVDWKSSLEVTAALRCVQVIADGISTVPLKIYRKSGNGAREAANDHPLADLLGTAPNEWQDGLQYRETLGFHTALCGNAFSFINRVQGRIVELIPIEPGRVEVKQIEDYALQYTVSGANGQREVFPQETIWHLRGPSWNSWMGLEPVRLAREALGLSLALEGSHARLHKNGLQTTGAWSVEGTLNEVQYKRLRAYIAKFTGVDSTGTPLIMDSGAKWQPQALSGVDAEHLATRRHQIEEVCRAFGVLPIMVGFSDKTATYASAEQMFLAHAVHTIRPWHRRLEASIRRNLLTAAERAQGFYPKFIDTELLRGAAKDRAEYYSKALGAGGSPAWLTQNEVREFEELDRHPDGDALSAGTQNPPASSPAIP